MKNVKIKLLRENASVPKYATAGAAGADLCAAIDSPLTVEAGKRALVPTGISIELPDNKSVAVICARSGLSIKHGLTMANGVGIIDSDYRGELCVPMVNLGDKDYSISPGERVAQLLIMPVEIASFILTEELGETDRGSGGFGSTGKI